MLGEERNKSSTGVVTIKANYYAETITEAMFGLAEGFENTEEVGRDVTQSQDGTFSVSVTFQGGEDSFEDTPPPEANFPTYQMSSAFEDTPIEAHPELPKLLSEYGGQMIAGKAIWPPTLPNSNTSNATSGLGGTANEEPRKNPLCGVQKFKKLTVQWSVSYIKKSIPGGILEKVGKITTSPPGNAPAIKGRTKWLCTPPTARRRGTVAEITENYLLLDEDIAKELYGLDASDPEPEEPEAQGDDDTEVETTPVFEPDFPYTIISFPFKTFRSIRSSSEID